MQMGSKHLWDERNSGCKKLFWSHSTNLKLGRFSKFEDMSEHHLAEEIKHNGFKPLHHQTLTSGYFKNKMKCNLHMGNRLLIIFLRTQCQNQTHSINFEKISFTGKWETYFGCWLLFLSSFGPSSLKLIFF